MRRRSIFSFVANPFVVLADVMVSLVFIVSLFLLATTVYSEQMELIAQRDLRRQRMATTLEEEFKGAKLIGANVRREQLAPNKYRIGNVLEVEDDGTLQRFRFLDQLNYKPNTADFEHPQAALKVLAVFGRVVLKNRSQIKSLVIEGHAEPGEANPWLLSESRAESIRARWAGMNVLQDIEEDYTAPVFRFLKKRNLWDYTRFTEWHLQEHQARRRAANGGLGVLPAGWVIVSGRGDQVRHKPVVEFKLEYTERDAAPLDDYINALPEELRRQAVQQGIIKK